MQLLLFTSEYNLTLANLSSALQVYGSMYQFRERSFPIVPPIWEPQIILLSWDFQGFVSSRPCSSLFISPGVIFFVIIDHGISYLKGFSKEALWPLSDEGWRNGPRGIMTHPRPHGEVAEESEIDFQPPNFHSIALSFRAGCQKGRKGNQAPE